MKKINYSNIILIMMLVLGVSLLLYPTVADVWNSFHQSRVINTYTENINQMSNQEYQNMKKEANDFNQILKNLEYPWLLNDEMKEQYYATLDIDGVGMMGYIEIPVLNIKFPIYHGTSDTTLQVAIGHVEGSSLPIGGESTHSVLSGHRGLPSAKLFTDLDKLQIQDYFLIHVLDDTYTYEVDQIRIVLPQELEELTIQEGKDYCTLVTCTPYGINTHRLLVRGHRIENDASIQSARISTDAIQVDGLIVALFLLIPVVILVILTMLIVSSIKRKGGKYEKNQTIIKNNDFN